MITKTVSPIVFRLESKAKSFVTIAKDEVEMNEWYNEILNAVLEAMKYHTLEGKIAPIWTSNSNNPECEICGNQFSF